MNKQLVSVLMDVFNLRAEQIIPELTKDQVGSWDSLKQMDLVMSLEREFNISLEITDIVRLTSVSNIMEILAEKEVNLEA
jgi:acyl carrier protein